MTSHFNIIADDYGLSPSVSDAIRELIQKRKITGTSCMTLFPEWPDQARSLNRLRAGSKIDIGLHLTLTDFVPLSTEVGGKRMPSLGRLLVSNVLGFVDGSTIEAELDMQLERFMDCIGVLPDFIDGHQHVHFLPIVRRWLEARWHRLEHDGRLPWLRGAPSQSLAFNFKTKAKVALVELIATGFDERMRSAGFPVRGPLTGFYDWDSPENFSRVISRLKGLLPHNSVVMCHPGLIDDTLILRDKLIQARPVEFEALLQAPKLNE